MDAVSARLEADFPETNQDWYPIVEGLQSVFVGPVRPALLVAVGASKVTALGDMPLEQEPARAI